MSADDDSPAIVTIATPRFSLDLLTEVHQSQMANGLRERNFLRYHAYCTRRLRRLRKSVRFLHGKGKFVQKKIDPDNVHHVRHLLILLNICERAWAHAMEIKVDVVEENSRSRFHMRRRLSKAMNWAQNLVDVCEKTADTLTHVQAECYLSYMSGNVYLEREEIGKALLAFSHSMKILDSLLKVADSPQQREIYNSRIQALQPNIRFCEFKIKQEGVNTSDLTSVDELDVVLSSKLSAARQERDAQIVANAVDHITWNGHQIPIKSDVVKNAIAKAIDMKNDINASSPSNDILACFDALDIARSAISTCLKNAEQSEADKAALQSLLAFINESKLQVTLQRNLNLFNQLSIQIEQGNDAKASADDFVVMCEKILANLSSLEGQNSPVNPDMVSRFNGHRYLFMGKKLLGQAEWIGAVHFFEKSIGSYPRGDFEFIARAQKCSIMARLSSSCGKEMDVSQIPLKQRLQTWSTDSRVIAEVPPLFVCTFCKPVQFDLAAGGLTYPSVDSRLARGTSKGWLSRLWG